MRPQFDWRQPDYAAVFRQRIEALQRIRREPQTLPVLRAYYKEHIADFISDWGCTVDPRLVGQGLPSTIPFILFPKQRDWVSWLMEHWQSRTPGLTEKSREMGVSWLAIATSCAVCLFHSGAAIGFGSRKAEYVDHIGAPKALFTKARTFMRLLPPEFQGGWQEERDAPYMRVNFPGTGSHISGEGGDNIGRGDRTSIYFVDEAAYLEHPDMVEASLSQTTNCRIDIGTPNGMANPFATKRFGGRIDVFTFHWRDDPRKDDAWYAKQCAELDPVVVAQEVDINYQASVEGLVIPSAWAQAAVNSHIKLGVAVSGARRGSLDIADRGMDKCAFVSGHGILIDRIEEWSGKQTDTFDTVQRAFNYCDQEGCDTFRYDSDGLGALVRGDARVINERRAKAGQRQIEPEAFRGSEGVTDPEGEDVKGRKNQDYFLNRKAQAWWALRRRFQNTYRAVVEKSKYDPNEIVSISSACPLHVRLLNELSQPTYKMNTVGKMVIDKAPDAASSPNMGDAVMQYFSSSGPAQLRVTGAILSNPRLFNAGRGGARYAHV